MMKRIFSACLTFLMIAILSAVTVFAAMDGYDDGYIVTMVDSQDGTTIEREIGLGCLNTDDVSSGSASTSTYSIADYSAYDASVHFSISIYNAASGASDSLDPWDQGVTYAYASASVANCPDGFEYSGVSSTHSSSVVNNDNPSDIRSGSISLSIDAN
ncbi:MAG: hypothetical protein ACI3XP_03490 [Eubacteriales bacterium]